MTTGKYIRRSVGYFLKLLIIVCVLYLLLFATGASRVSAELIVQELFASRQGLLLIAALAVLSGFYPRFGYVSRTVKADITAERDAIINAFHAGKYIIIKDNAEKGITFRADSIFRRLWLTFDDEITVTPAEDGITIEGIRKEVVYAEFRIKTYINNRNDETK